MQNKKGKRVLMVEPMGNLPAYVFPLALSYLKSNMPDQHTVKVLDCSYHNITADSPKFRMELIDFRPNVLAVTASVQTAEEAIKAVKVAKSVDSSIVTIMGGAYPSTFPESIRQNESLDFIFKGEGELSFPVFLDKLNVTNEFSDLKGLVYRKNGEIVENEINIEPDLDKIRIPDYKALKLDDYIKSGYSYGGYYGRIAPIWITRGCPYACSFCSSERINGRRIRRHSLEYLRGWIDHLYKDFCIRQFAIVDDNFTFYPEYAKEFCRMIIQLRGNEHFKEKIFFTTPNGIRMDRVDDELLELMRKTGWDGVTVAPESGSRKTLKRMRKKLDPDKVPGMVARIKASGLKVRAFFMVGYPGETWDDINDTIKLIRRCKFDSFSLGRFQPIPGTPIFNEMV